MIDDLQGSFGRPATWAAQRQAIAAYAAALPPVRGIDGDCLRIRIAATEQRLAETLDRLAAHDAGQTWSSGGAQVGYTDPLEAERARWKCACWREELAILKPLREQFVEAALRTEREFTERQDAFLARIKARARGTA